MSTYKLVGQDGLLYFWQKIKTLLAGKADTSSVPTKVSQLTNDSNYLTAHQDLTNYALKSYVDSAVSGLSGMTYSIVSSLPTTGAQGTIYLMSNGGSGQNIYDEYIWMSSTSTYEKIGTTATDLSNYLKSSDVVPITNAEIDAIITS